MRKPVGRLWRRAVLVSCGLLLIVRLSYARQDDGSGHSIGKVSTKGGLIVMELDEGALGKANLFDLTGRTLRFTPENSRYRVESERLHWYSDYGPELTGAEASLHEFSFPFSGKLWESFLVGTTGSIRFGPSEKNVGLDPYGHRDRGILLDRFDQLAELAHRLIEKAPAIPGLQARVRFPYSLPIEASTLGGGVWQDNFDGTYTQLRGGYFVPATGYSDLDLYLMGLISAAEVPDFFILRNLVRAGKDTNGRLAFRAERTKVTIQDVIAAEGPRLPDVDNSQRKFNTGIVVVVEHGQTPSPELIERASGIRKQWIEYWETTTGHRASMTANPR